MHQNCNDSNISNTSSNCEIEEVNLVDTCTCTQTQCDMYIHVHVHPCTCTCM